LFQGIFVARHQHQPRAALGSLARGGQSDAAGGAGDHDDLFRQSFQAVFHFDTPFHEGGSEKRACGEIALFALIIPSIWQNAGTGLQFLLDPYAFFQAAPVKAALVRQVSGGLQYESLYMPQEAHAVLQCCGFALCRLPFDASATMASQFR
jgi:hypothetical protein